MAYIEDMATLHQAKVLSVHHWNETLFSFTTTRDQALRFKSGQFGMIGMEIEGKPLLRAYSFVGAHYDECLEFYSIKVDGGRLTSRLQHVKVGDSILVNSKATGTLVLSTVTPSQNLYLLATGTGLAPFMSILRDPDTYDRFEKVILVHGVRNVSELGYSDYIQSEIGRHPLVGEQAKSQLLYYPTVTREPFVHQGRITELLDTGKLNADLGLEPLDRDRDRVMICGSPAMLADTVALLEARDFSCGSAHAPGDYTYERAFAEA